MQHFNTDSDDILDAYMNAIGDTPLLSADEEATLARASAAGRHADADAATKRAGLDAREQLITANLRLVVSVAKDYRPYCTPSMAFEDLIAEGNIGLMRAVEKFEPERGLRLTTYAYHWIRQAVTRALAEQGRAIRLPVHVSDTIGQIRRVGLRAGHDLSVAELVAATGRPERTIARALESMRTIDSLNRQIDPSGDGEPIEIGEIVAAPQDDVDETAMRELMRADIAQALLDELDDRERELVVLRYGLLDGEMHTLEVVGQHFNLTRERARQIQEHALDKLRAACGGLRAWVQ